MFSRKIGLRLRLTVLIGVTLATAAGVFLYLGTSAVDETEEAAQREQLSSTARTVASHVDDVLSRTSGREEHLARMVANAWSRGETELNNLLDAYPRLLFESDLYLLQPHGELVWSMRPGVTIPGGVTAEPLVRESVESLRSTVGSCGASITSDLSRACFASPVLRKEGEAAGVLLAQIELGRPELRLFSLEQLNETVRIELVHADGVILAANDASAGGLSAHAEALALASDERSRDGTYAHSADGEESAHSFGYAPVSAVPEWAVVVEPRDAAALALGGGAETRLLVFGLAALPLSLAVAWLAAGQLLRPLRAVASGAERVAAGDLHTPVIMPGGDELADLSRAIESLRLSLKDAHAEAEAIRRLGATRGHLIDGLFARQEEERQRLADELHEGTLQSLAALALRLDSLQGELPNAGQGVRDRLTRVHSLAAALIGDLRRLAVQLRPPMLNDLGLTSAVQSYAESRLLPEEVRINLDSSGMEERLPPHVETSLYRIAEEAINNVAIHAEAGAATITLRCDGRVVTLIVEDDGRGFDPAEVLADPNAERGLGILSMRERIAYLGGAFKIESAPGHGTRVRAEIPLVGESII